MPITVINISDLNVASHFKSLCEVHIVLVKKQLFYLPGREVSLLNSGDSI